MAFGLSKLSRDRPHGVHPDLVRVVECAIQITTQDFRVQAGLRTRECQPASTTVRGCSSRATRRSKTAIGSSLGPVNTLSWPTRAVVGRKDGVSADGAVAG